MFENITFFTFERKPKTDVMFWMRIGLWKKTVMFLILRPHWLVEEKRDGCEFCNIIALWKEEHVLCFEFYNILACKRKKRKNLMIWRNATSLLCRQKNRDVFDKTPMVFFLFQKSTFVINENNITQNWISKHHNITPHNSNFKNHTICFFLLFWNWTDKCLKTSRFHFRKQ